MKTNSHLRLSLLFAVLLALLAPCRLLANNLILNGGFEAGEINNQVYGLYTSTLGGYTNTGVPNNWVPNVAFDEYASDNHVASGLPHSGNTDLQIGNFEYQPIPTLSQTFSDVSGATYSVVFWAANSGFGYNDLSAFLDVSVDGTAGTSIYGSEGAYWTEFSFTFTGTGSDTLIIGGNNNAGEWKVDDVSVTQEDMTPTPEPSSLLFFATGLVTLTGAIRRKFAR
jgi:hypothetical protein